MGVFDDEQPGQWKVLPLVRQGCGEPAVAAANLPLHPDNHLSKGITYISRSEQSLMVDPSDPGIDADAQRPRKRLRSALEYSPTWA